jgi:hypothetical protein
MMDIMVHGTFLQKLLGVLDGGINVAGASGFNIYFIELYSTFMMHGITLFLYNPSLP